MRAIIKKTGEIIEVICNKYGDYVDGNCVAHNLEDLSFFDKDIEHWHDVRERAVIAATQGLTSNPEILQSTGNNASIDNIEKTAIRLADAIVEQLKDKS